MERHTLVLVVLIFMQPLDFSCRLLYSVSLSHLSSLWGILRVVPTVFYIYQGLKYEIARIKGAYSQNAGLVVYLKASPISSSVTPSTFSVI